MQTRATYCLMDRLIECVMVWGGMLAGDLVEALPEAWLALEQELST